MAKKASPKAKKAKKQDVTGTTVVTILVDESSSMSVVAGPTRTGFNEYVETLQKDLKGQKVYFSAILFDSRGVRKLQVGAPLESAIKLTEENYVPTGSTPLIDACAKAILATDEVFAKEKANKAIIVFQTDGEENCSKEYNRAQLKAMIEERKPKGYEFVFIGAGIDAYAEASSIGISTANTVSYGKTDHHTRATFVGVAMNSTNYASGAAATMAFSPSQKAASGDPSGTVAISKSQQQRHAATGRVDTWDLTNSVNTSTSNMSQTIDLTKSQ